MSPFPSSKLVSVMMDKTEEHRRTAAVKRRFPAALQALGFIRDKGGCSRDLDGHRCRIWLQKFRHMPQFRVAMSFHPAGGDDSRWVTEFADAWTYKDSPGGRKYDFGIRWGDDAVDRCLREVHDFVENVAISWFAERASEARDHRDQISD